MIKSSLVPCRPCCQDVKALTGHPPVLSASGARGALDIGGGGRGGAIIRPISAVPPKFMSVIRAHSSKLPVNRPFSMKRLLFVILRCFDWSSPWSLEEKHGFLGPANGERRSRRTRALGHPGRFYRGDLLGDHNPDAVAKFYFERRPTASCATLTVLWPELGCLR